MSIAIIIENIENNGSVFEYDVLVGKGGFEEIVQ